MLDNLLYFSHSGLHDSPRIDHGIRSHSICITFCLSVCLLVRLSTYKKYELHSSRNLSSQLVIFFVREAPWYAPGCHGPDLGRLWAMGACTPKVVVIRVI